MITLQNITLARGNQVLLEKANLSIAPYEKVGLIGRNGCGKSSLFALLLGQLHEEAGEVLVPEKWRLAYLSQSVPDTDLPALDFVLGGHAPYQAIMAKLDQAMIDNDGEKMVALHHELDTIDGYRIPAEAAEVLHGLGFSAQEQLRPVNTFSGGWRMRLNLAKTLMCPSDLLLLDEPTNHLDLDAILWLEKWLKNYQGTVLIVAHDSAFLDAVVTGIGFVANKQIDYYKGNYSQFLKLRALKLSLQQNVFERQQKTIAHLQGFINRFKAKASKAKQAKSREKALDRMELVAQVHADASFAFEFSEITDCPNPLIRVKKANIGYGDKIIIENADIYLGPGDRVGLLGLNGAGKSTVMKLLAGKLIPLAGDMVVANGLKIGYFAQHQLELLDKNSTLVEFLQDFMAKYAKESKDAKLLSIQQMRDFLGRFGFIGEKVFDKIEVLSGGEKARLVLALLVWQAPHLLLLDEPTNHLDLETREALTLALQSFNGAMVVVSHDRELLKETTDSLWLVDDGAVTEFEGDVEDYSSWIIAKRGQIRKAARQKKPESTVENNSNKNNNNINNKKIQKLDKLLLEKQSQMRELDLKLASPEALKMAQIWVEQKHSIEKEIEEIEAQWFALHQD